MVAEVSVVHEEREEILDQMESMVNQEDRDLGYGYSIHMNALKF